MATFNFRALTEDGRIVSNKVEEGNRITLIKKLKANGLYPISVTQNMARKTHSVKKKKNISNINNNIEKINTNVTMNDNRRRMIIEENLP